MKPERAEHRWFWDNLLLGLTSAWLATLNRWMAVIVVVFLVACKAVTERLAYWQRRKIETLEARRG